MKRGAYRQLGDGEWSNKSKRRRNGTWVHKIRCCDRGLAHIIQYELTRDERLRFRAWRVPCRMPAFLRDRQRSVALPGK